MSEHEYKQAIKKIKSFVITQKTDNSSFRNNIEENFSVKFLPNRVEYRSVKMNDISCDVLVPELYVKNRVVLYVHGGSFIGGSCASWRSFCSSIANESSSRVIVPEFHLAPEYPYPCSVEDIKKVFNSLLEMNAKIIIMADSSGASIAFSMLLKMSHEEPQLLSNISQIILFSPWLDVSSTSSLFACKRLKDPVLTLDTFKISSLLYSYEKNLNSSYVSPLKAGFSEFKHFPPVYIQIGSNDVLLSNVYLFKEILSQAGVKCYVDKWDKMFYLFQMADEYLQDAQDAIKKIGKYIKGELNLTDFN